MIVYRLTRERRRPNSYTDIRYFKCRSDTEAEIKSGNIWYRNPVIEEVEIPDLRPNEFFKAKSICAFLTEDAYNSVVLFSDYYDEGTIRKPKDFPAFFQYCAPMDLYHCGSWERTTREEILDSFYGRITSLQNQINDMEELITNFKKWGN